MLVGLGEGLGFFVSSGMGVAGSSVGGGLGVFVGSTGGAIVFVGSTGGTGVFVGAGGGDVLLGGGVGVREGSTAWGGGLLGCTVELGSE